METVTAGWAAAFAVTQAVEMPVYVFGALRSNASRLQRWGLAFGASALTHPIVWFVLPPLFGNWLVYVIVAETFAVLAEGMFLFLVGGRRPWLFAVAANAASVVTGEAARALGLL